VWISSNPGRGLRHQRERHRHVGDCAAALHRARARHACNRIATQLHSFLTGSATGLRSMRPVSARDFAFTQCGRCCGCAGCATADPFAVTFVVIDAFNAFDASTPRHRIDVSTSSLLPPRAACGFSGRVRQDGSADTGAPTAGMRAHPRKTRGVDSKWTITGSLMTLRGAAAHSAGT
jgi:hypothetical protein